MNTEQMAIHSMIDSWVSAINRKDISQVLAHHANGILMFDVPEPLQLKGLDAYRKSWEDMFFPWYGEDGTFELSGLEITAGNDIAFCHGIIDCSGTENGQKIFCKARLTMCLQKIDDVWTIMHEHHSMPLR